MKLARRGMMFVISSPSGVGKTTICNYLLQNYSSQLKSSISVTTRKKRVQEIDGQNYYFVSQEEFFLMRDHNELLEYAEVFKNFYGTPKKFVHDTLSRGYDVLFDIDWQGAKELSKKSSDDLVRLFILPPSMTELARRLKKRGQDNTDVMNYRLQCAAEELIHYYDYDFILINNNLVKTLQQVSAIYEAECLRCTRFTDLEEFISDLRNELS